MSRLAVVPVRAGTLPAGGREAVAECDGRALVVGDGAVAAAGTLAGVARGAVQAWDTPGFRPAAWAAVLATLVGDHDVVVLPGSPDGRDLAPRLAHALGRPLLAGALRVGDHGADVVRYGGLVIEELDAPGPFVATLQPGARGVDEHAEAAKVELITPATGDERDALVVEVLPPDAATMDLSEAPRIVGGGAGLDGAARFEQLAAIARALDASMGATRVVTDRGWVEHARQIGTTGVVVDPRIYLAFGISGAVQHTSGLGSPQHIVSVNVEPHCPMMQLADLAIVADANAVLDELARRLSVDGP
ncbi:MAG: electron transfer flavoprotein alpha subunit [Acidimicrobiaceae bacterium]|nr:electron transfer flavoprotein alpha subunit [Acidimicrobiaceae bacterium]